MCGVGDPGSDVTGVRHFGRRQLWYICVFDAILGPLVWVIRKYIAIYRK